ncbi:MAG TPA: molecular chaperone DnaJ, partial [Alphaproteobacteria bacterium]|nr:molecular chaperone DnaJ [Alphaproteobacteria bacterium]
LLYLILGIALLAGVLLTGRWFANADPKALIKVLKWFFIAIILVAIVFLALSGRLAWAIAAVPALIVWLMRLRAAHRAFRAFGGAPGERPPGAMTVEEAWRVLGLEPGASRDEIKKTHRRLIAGLHPDRGGSDYLAAKINQAKDLLLGK